MASFSVMSDVPNPVFDSNGNPFSGAVLKAFLPGGTTSTSIAIDEDGGSPQASITYNAAGKLEVTGNEILPYIDKKHKWGIFANATDAAANTPFYMGPFDNVPRPSDENNIDNTISRLNPATLAIWQADTSAEVGDVVTTKERSTGNGGGAAGDVISGTGTANGKTIVAHGSLSLSWVLKKDIKKIDLSVLGYTYGATEDKQPFMDEFLTFFNDLGATLEASKDTFIANPAWLNAVPKNVNFNQLEGFKTTANIPNTQSNFDEGNALINLRGTRGVASTTVTAPILKDSSTITVASTTGIVVDGFLELNLREQTVDGINVISRQIARLVRVLAISGLDVTTDFVFPFGMTFSGGGSAQTVFTDIDPARGCSVDFEYNDISTFTANVDSGTISADRDHLTMGVHLFHAYDCKVSLTADGIKNTALNTTFANACTFPRAIGIDADIFGPSEGYLVKVTASHNCNGGSLRGNGLRHTLDFSNAGYCTFDEVFDSNSEVTGLTTHGISEHNIRIKTYNGVTIGIAESGSEFGFHSQDIFIDHIECETFLAGYVERLFVGPGNISTNMNVRRGGEYKIKANIGLLDIDGRNGRPGALVSQGVTHFDGTIQKYDVIGIDYLRFVRSRMLENVSDQSTIDDLLEGRYMDIDNVGHIQQITDSCREIIINGGQFNTEGLSLVGSYFSTTRLEGGDLTLTWGGACKILGNGTSAATSLRMLQFQQFNDNGVNKILINISGNTIDETPVDAASVNAGVYDIDSFSTRANLRRNAAILVAGFVTSDDTDITV